MFHSVAVGRSAAHRLVRGALLAGQGTTGATCASCRTCVAGVAARATDGGAVRGVRCTAYTAPGSGRVRGRSGCHDSLSVCERTWSRGLRPGGSASAWASHGSGPAPHGRVRHSSGTTNGIQYYNSLSERVRTARPFDGMEVSVLGTASGSPSVYRSLSSYAVRMEKEQFVVDTGENTQQQIRDCQLISLHDTTAIFITHMHGRCPDIRHATGC